MTKTDMVMVPREPTEEKYTPNADDWWAVEMRSFWGDASHTVTHDTRRAAGIVLDLALAAAPAPQPAIPKPLAMPEYKYQDIPHGSGSIAPAPQPASVEEIARLIDPDAFEQWQSLHDYCARPGNPNPDKPTWPVECANRHYGKAKGVAMDKTRAILSRTAVTPEVVSADLLAAAKRVLECAVSLDQEMTDAYAGLREAIAKAAGGEG